MRKTIVIGGGPAGMVAALAASKKGDSVDLYEKNEKLGKKLYITGKGRCNLTNLCDRDDFFAQIMRHPRFMYSAFAAFNNYDLMGLIEDAGCPLKVERGNRVFPESNKSSDIIKAFSKALGEAGVRVHLHSNIKKIQTQVCEDQQRAVGVQLNDGTEISGDRIILASGGLSYKSTGSDGQGLRMAEKLGHRISECRPSLVGLTTVEQWPKQLQGLSLRNAGLTLYCKGKKVAYEQGEMLFTHCGISGPMVLTHSARMDGNPQDYTVSIDLKPALSEEQIHQRIMREFEKYKNKQYQNALGDLLPAKMIPVFVQCSEIPGEKRINQINKKERQAIERLLKSMCLSISGFVSMDSAIITAGGIDTTQINPKTMESKIIKDLYFAGEVIDVDALTGGYNIQIAASTGWLAGEK